MGRRWYRTPATLTLNSAGLVDTKLAGTQVTFDGIAAPLVYTSARQISAVVPYGASSAHPQVILRYLDQPSAPFSVTLAHSLALFTADSSGKAGGRAE